MEAKRQQLAFPTVEVQQEHWKKKEAVPTVKLRLVEQLSLDGRQNNNQYYTEVFEDGQWRYIPESLSYNRENAEMIFNQIVRTKNQKQKIVLKEVTL